MLKALLTVGIALAAILAAQDLSVAEALLAKGEHSQALAFLEENQTGSARWHFVASKVLDDLDQPTRAAEEAQTAVELAPDNAGYRLHLGRIFLTRNNPAAAQQIYAEALERFPSNVYLRLGNALAFNKLRLYEEAQVEFETCLGQLPSLGLALDGLMEAHLERLKYDDALKAAVEYRERNPQDFRGYYHSAVAQEKLGSDPEALERLLHQALEFNGRFAPAHALLGKTLLQLGRNQEAILALEAAVRLRPDYLLGRLHLARAYRKVGRLEDAKKEAEIVKELERRQHEPVPSLRRQSGS